MTARPRRWAPVAVVVAAVGLVAVALLTKGTPITVVVPSVAVEPSAPAASAVIGLDFGEPTEAPTKPAGPSPTTAPPGLDRSVTPNPTFAAVPAAPGTVRLGEEQQMPIRLSMVLPDGWEKATDEMYVKGRGEAPAGVSIGAWSLRDVQVFPCRWSAGVVADPALMTTAAGQAEALSDWWGQDPLASAFSTSPIAPAATRPTATTFAGYPARYLETLIYLGFDFTQCDAGQLLLWDATNGDIRYGLGPGELHRLWVVDANGSVVVIDAASYPGTSATDQAELQAMLDSITIEP